MRSQGTSSNLPQLAVATGYPLSDEEFHLFQDLVKAQTGIALSDFKRSLVQARLSRRLRQLGLGTYREYYTYLMERDPTGEERIRFINAMTTNKTEFFREPHHFIYLQQVWLPSVRTRAQKTGERRIRIWSAGCSTGEEAYSIAITLWEGLQTLLGWDVRILASDIDTEVLARAQEGVYALDQIRAIPEDLLHRYFQKGTGAQAGLIRVVPKLRDLITFRRINLLDEPWPIRTRFDVIFCRNVMIYFEKPTQHRLFHRFEAALQDGGLLILGHSESLLGSGARFHPLGQTIYQKWLNGDG